MSARIGRRTRHRRHKASTLERKRQWIKRLVRSRIPPPPPTSHYETPLMVGGPLDGQRQEVDGHCWRVAMVKPGAQPYAPDVRTVTYVRTREFAKSRDGCTNRVWLMQPDDDKPIGPDFKALPRPLRDRIEAILS